MLIIVKTRLRRGGKASPWTTIQTGFTWAIWVAGCLALLFSTAHAQQTLPVEWNGKTYQADVSWVVKHNNSDFRSKTEHIFDLQLDPSIDLAVYFNFSNDSLPPDPDVVWGFQFNHTGGLLTPGTNEKRARSRSQFQRFEVARAGTTTLTITPRAWRKTASGKFEPIASGKPFNLVFTITDSSRPLAARPITPDTSRRTIPEIPRPNPAESPATSELRAEETAFADARAVPDTIQKIKALMDFVDKYAPLKPQSKLVAEAIRNVPLGISVPEDRGDGTYTYTLNYASRPIIDSAEVRGWDWQLMEGPFGKYRLVLTDLRDTVHRFKLADSGKNAPFNTPKELHPFERINIRFLGEFGDSFRIRAVGGNPPFMVFLVQDGFPKERYIMDQTDTTWSFSKVACNQCRTGAYSLEVYTSDFSTLLLKVDKAVHVRRISYALVLLGVLISIPLLYFAARHFRRFWTIFTYERKLRQIEKWEIREAREEEKRKVR